MSYLFGGIEKTVTTISSSQILAFNNGGVFSFVNIIPAPPAGFMIFPQLVMIEYLATADPFSPKGSGDTYIRQYMNGLPLSTGIDDGVCSGLLMTGLENKMTILGRPVNYVDVVGPSHVDIGSFGPTQTVTLALTSVETTDGTDSQYHGTIGTLSGNYAGYTFTVTGFTNPNNNGTFMCDPNVTPSNTPTTIELMNPNGAAETHIATAVSVNHLDASALQLGSTTDWNGGGVLTATVTLANGGASYAPGDTGLLSGAGDTYAQYTVLTAPGGVVATVSITQPGSAYYLGGGGGVSTAITTTPQTGSGNGSLELDLGSVQKGTGSLRVTSFYQ